jgi:hypothetical protein
VTLELEGQPLWVANCHCKDCRKATGAAFATYVGCKTDQIELTGHISEYRSSPQAHRLFCGSCGTPVAYRGERWPGETHFFVGFFEEPASFVPVVNVYTADELPWTKDIDNLPRFQRTPKDEQPAAE